MQLTINSQFFIIVNQFLEMKFLLFFVLILTGNIQAQTIIPVGLFSQSSLTEWKEKTFAGKTHYQLINNGKKPVLKAQSRQSASGLYKEMSINLDKTPYLNWSWQIDSMLENLDEQSKDGDDYAARIYIVKKHKYLFWKTKAINYVWSSNQEKNTHWNNAYAEQAKMLAVRGKNSEIRQWYQEKRNVKEDFKRYFDDDVDQVDVIAIMSDTDNSKSSVQAYYGDIYFSSE